MATFNISRSRVGGIANTENHPQASGFGTANVTKTLSDMKREGLRCMDCQYKACLTYETCVRAGMEHADARTSVLRMRFTCAAMAGDIPAMRRYLEALPSPDMPDPWGTTALSFVVMVGNRAAVEELLRMGADPLRVNRSGRSPLDNAIDAFPPVEEIVGLLKQAARSRHAGRDDAAPHPDISAPDEGAPFEH